MLRTMLLAAAAAVALAAAPLAGAAAGTSITMNAVQIFGTIDPAKVKDYTEYMAAVNLYEGLTTVNPAGEVLPLVAERWEISDDHKTYTFHLKDGITFQSGTPVKAADVVWSVQRLLTLNQGPAFLFSGLIDPDGVKAVDDRTVEIRLNRIYAPFLASTPLLFVLESAAVKAGSAADDPWGQAYVGDHSVGSGPYRLGSWERGGALVLERYEGYHGGFPDKPVDEVRLIVTKDEATVRAMLTRGELQMTSNYQANETYDAIAKLPNYRVISDTTGTGFYIKLNHKAAPTDDEHVRKAIADAVDYATIREQLYPGAELRGPLPAAFKGAYDDSLPAPVFDLEKAKAELAQSRYAGTGKIPLVHSYVSGTQFEEDIALLLKSTLDEVGFDVTLQPEPWNRITELASKPETTPATTQIFNGPTYASPDSMFYVQYHSKAAGTWSSMSWLQDPEVDALIDAARQEVDPDKQNAIYRQLQQKLVATQADVYLLNAVQRHGISTCLDGYQWLPIQSFGYNFSKFRWTC